MQLSANDGIWQLKSSEDWFGKDTDGRAQGEDESTYFYYVFLLPLPPSQHLKWPHAGQRRDPHLPPGLAGQGDQLPTLPLIEAWGIEPREQKLFEERFGQASVCAFLLERGRQSPNLVAAGQKDFVPGSESDEMDGVPRELQGESDMLGMADLLHWVRWRMRDLLCKEWRSCTHKGVVGICR